MTEGPTVMAIMFRTKSSKPPTAKGKRVILLCVVKPYHYVSSLYKYHCHSISKQIILNRNRCVCFLLSAGVISVYR